MTFNATEYTFDLDKIFEYIKTNADEQRVEREITDGYDMEDNDPKLVSKMVREITAMKSDDIDTYKYDMLKLLIDTLLSKQEDTGFFIAFNTMFTNGFIKSINNTDNYGQEE